MQPKEHVLSARPAKGNACALCDAKLDVAPSVLIQVQAPLFKFKTITQRGCIPCAKELRSLLDLRIGQAEKGEFQA